MNKKMYVFGAVIIIIGMMLTSCTAQAKENEWRAVDEFINGNGICDLFQSTTIEEYDKVFDSNCEFIYDGKSYKYDEIRYNIEKFLALNLKYTFSASTLNGNSEELPQYDNGIYTLYAYGIFNISEYNVEPKLPMYLSFKFDENNNLKIVKMEVKGKKDMFELICMGSPILWEKQN